MRIPEKIKVGNFIYDVEITNYPIICEGLVCQGLCDSENQKLYLSSDLTKQNLERVFIHELLHSIQMDRCLDLGEDTELIIDEMAKGLHQVINDNLGLFVKNK